MLVQRHRRTMGHRIPYRVGAAVEREQYEALNRIADETGTNVSTVLRQMITDWLACYEQAHRLSEVA